MQVMLITTALLAWRNVAVQLETYFVPSLYFVLNNFAKLSPLPVPWNFNTHSIAFGRSLLGEVPERPSASGRASAV